MTTQKLIEKRIENARTRFEKALPQRMTCPHCQQSRKKEFFGVRLMNGPEAAKGKVEPKFARQSHCNTCRG